MTLQSQKFREIYQFSLCQTNCHACCGRIETSPEIIVSDNGTQFTSNLFRQFLQEHKIRHMLVPAYHPQANQVEATNKNVKTLLRMELLRRLDHRDWSSYLQKVIMNLNTVPRMPTGQSPHFLVFGREKNQSGLEHRLVDDANRTELTVEQETERREIIYENVAEQQRAAFEQNSKRYNLRAKPRTFNDGDAVFIRNNLQSSAGDSVTKKLAEVKKMVYVVTTTEESTYYVQKKVEGSSDIYTLVDGQGKLVGDYHANQIYTK